MQDTKESIHEKSIFGKAHEERYRSLIKNIEQDVVFKRDKVVQWKCCNCEYIHEGTEPPEECPACAHARAYFELWTKNY